MGRVRFAVIAAAAMLAVSAGADAQNAFTSRPAFLRAGPDASYPLVAQLGPGTPVDVQGCLDDWSWCDVIYDDTRGWMYAPSLSYVYEGTRVPLYSYAPSFGIPIITFSLGGYWDRYYRGRPWFRDRDDWEHRRIPHHRPPGPPPRTSPPPRTGTPYARPGRGFEPGRSGVPERGRAPPAAPERFGRPSEPREGAAAPERFGRGSGAPGGTAPPPERRFRPSPGRQVRPPTAAPERGAPPARGAAPERSAPPARGAAPDRGGPSARGAAPAHGARPTERGNVRRDEGSREQPH